MNIIIDLKEKKDVKEVIHAFLETMNKSFSKDGLLFPVLWENPNFGDGFIDDMFFLSLDSIKKDYGTSFHFIVINSQNFKEIDTNGYNHMISNLEDLKNQLLEFAKIDFIYEII